MTWKKANQAIRDQATTRDDGGTTPTRTPTKDTEVLSTRARRRQAARILKRRKRSRGEGHS
jgi:hypothetical protein